MEIKKKMMYFQFKCSSSNGTKSTRPAILCYKSLFQSIIFQTICWHWGYKLEQSHLIRICRHWDFPGGWTWVGCLGQENPMEEEMATHCSILAWEIPWTEELGGCRQWGCKGSDRTEQRSMHARIQAMFLNVKKQQH